MKTNYTLLMFLSLLLASPIIAQTNLPGPERVNNLVDHINGCKDNLKEAQKTMDWFEANPEEITHARWLRQKEGITMVEKCIAEARAALEEMRKDHPDWFNQPNLVLDLGHGRHMTPRELEQLQADIEEAIALMSRVFNGYVEPPH